MVSNNTISIDPVAAETIQVPIVGTTPLIVHRFAEKARRQILDKQTKRVKQKEPRDPQVEYEACFYYLKDGSYGFKAVGFKKATVEAARFYDKAVTMASLRQFLFFHGEPGTDGEVLVRIEGEPHMREDYVTIGQGSRDLRFRPEFSEWSATLEVTYFTNSLDRGSVLALIDAGGLGVGIGERRPGKSGDVYGTYRIDPTRDVEVLR